MINNKCYREIIKINLEKENKMGSLNYIEKPTNNEIKKVLNKEKLYILIQEALFTNGVHHKQWYLEEIVKELNISLPDENMYIPGIAP